MLKEWPFPGVLDLAIIAAVAAVYFGGVLVVGFLMGAHVFERIEKFRNSKKCRSVPPASCQT
jgi:hypothetical protein